MADFTYLVDKYDALATQLAPEALDLALQSVQIAGIVQIITGIVLLSIWGVIMSVCLKLEPESDLDNLYVVKWLSIALSSFILLLPGFLMTIDIWGWIAIWRPDLALTNQIISGLGSSK